MSTRRKFLRAPGRLAERATPATIKIPAVLTVIDIDAGTRPSKKPIPKTRLIRAALPISAVEQATSQEKVWKKCNRAWIDELKGFSATDV
ncbi:hypothetical protein D9M69_467660 [compost metagenome]